MSSIESSVQADPRRVVTLSRWVSTAVVALLVAGFFIATPVWLTNLRTGTEARPILVVAAAVSTAAVVLAHRWSWLATGVSLLPFLIVPWADSFVWAWLLAVLGVMVVAAAQSWRQAVPAWVAAGVIVGVYASGGYPAALPIGLVTSGGEYGFAVPAFVIYLVWHTAALIVAAALGNSARSRVRTAQAAEKERHALEVESVVSERARMARDLHDVVAHHVSLIAVRAESAPYQHPHLDADARAVLAAIATDARSAINELRHALTVLRRADGDDDTSPDAETQRRPQPVLDDVSGLIEQAREAGQHIEVTGQWPHLPAAPGYALYRAVQEGLTNARRHAPGQAVTLTLRQTDNGAGFTMSNPTQQTNAPHQAARGLLGMGERMTALGGTVRTESSTHEFTLRVDLPRSEQQ